MQHQSGSIVTNFDSGLGGCPLVEDTRATLLALRDSGQLSIGCVYVVNDYSRGTVGAAEIVLTATDVDEFSLEVDVRTSFDNSSWDGLYDIDTDLITYLADNRGNEVWGSAPVERFEWGSSRFTDCTVDGATWLTTGSTATYQRVTVSGFSDVDCQGMTGNWRDVIFDGYARVYANGATRCYLQYSEFSAFCYVLANGRDDFRVQYSLVTAGAQIRYEGGTRLWVQYSTLADYGYIQQTDGQLRVYQMLMSRGYVQQQGSGRLFLYHSEVNARAYVRNEATADNHIRYCTLDGYGYVYLRGSTSVRLRGSSVTSYGYINLLDCPLIYLYYNQVTSRGVIYGEGVENGRLYGNAVSSQGRIDVRRSVGLNYLLYNSVDSGADLRLWDATGGCRVYQSKASSESRQLYRLAGYNYHNSTQSRARLNAQAATWARYCYVHGNLNKVLGSGTYANRGADYHNDNY